MRRCWRNAQELLNRDANDVRALYFQGLAYENLAAEALVILKQERSGLQLWQEGKANT